MKPSCFLAFHATCARKHKLLMPMKSYQSAEHATLTCYCEKHLPVRVGPIAPIYESLSLLLLTEGTTDRTPGSITAARRRGCRRDQRSHNNPNAARIKDGSRLREVIQNWTTSSTCNNCTEDCGLYRKNIHTKKSRVRTNNLQVLES